MSLSLIESFSRESFLLETCSDEELQSKCNDGCRIEYTRCRYLCDNAYCQAICDREYESCLADCPCGEKCQEGCANCDHPLCEDGKELSSVLIMHGGSRDFPALVNFENFNQDLKISWHNNGPNDEEFFAAEGCSVLYEGTNYLFGGWFENRNGEKTYGPHILDGCEILKAPGASFQFDCFDGSVGFLPSEKDQEAYIMLYDGFSSVQGYDGSSILEIDFASPVDFHREIGGQIPLYQNHPILIAGYRTASVERYSPFDGWVKDERISFPEKNLYSYSAVWGDFGVVVFPGNTETGEIWRLSDYEWTSIGTHPWTSILRFSRAVLLSNFEAMVFGGNENQQFTKFTFSEDFSSIESEHLTNLPSLNYWGDPFAILVPGNYCVFS